MLKQNLAENRALARAGIACENDKPISCFAGNAVGAVIKGMNIAEQLKDPALAADKNIEFFDDLQNAAGPLKTLNGAASGGNSVGGISMLWMSKVLIPGVDISPDSLWQVKEEKLIEPDAYDEILKIGFNKFTAEKIIPRIIDPDYFAENMAIAAKNAPIYMAKYEEMGMANLTGGKLAANSVPFEQLCGMRSMSNFFMDCYTMLDKLVEVSDAIFAEKAPVVEEKLKQAAAARDAGDESMFGVWVGGWRGASGMISPKIWDKLVWPYMKAAAEQVLKYGFTPMFHLDQDWNRDIGRFADFPKGKVIFNTDGMTDLRHLRATLGSGYAFLGDVPATLLSHGTPQQVADYVTKLIDDVGPAGAFIASGCDAPINSKFENLAAMLKATNDWQ